MRVQLDGVIALLERRFVVAAVGVDDGEVARDDRGNRIERLREPHLFERLVEAADRHEARHRVPVMRRRVARVELRSATLELALGALPVPVLRRLDVRERRVRLGGVAVEHHRRRGARRRLRPCMRRLAHAVVRQQAVRVGEPAVRQRELRILDDRLLEEVERLVQPFVGALVQVIAPLQIEVARGQILRRPPAAAPVAGIEELRLELPDDGVRGEPPAPRRRRPSAASTDSDHRYDAVALSTRWMVMRSRSPDLRTPPVSSIAACCVCSSAPCGRWFARLKASGRAAPRASRGGGSSPAAGPGRSSPRSCRLAVIGERQDRDRVLCRRASRRSNGVPADVASRGLKTGA